MIHFVVQLCKWDRRQYALSEQWRLCNRQDGTEGRMSFVNEF